MRERDEFDFVFELEMAELTGDSDRCDLALMRRFPEFRPVDMAFFGGWDGWKRMLFALPDPATPAAGHLPRLLDEWSGGEEQR